MKKIALLISVLALASCSFSGKYASDTQTFDWTTTIVIPVEDCKK
jgi:hypothetical protein